MTLHWRVRALCFVAFLVVASCETSRSSQDSTNPAGPTVSAPSAATIHFLTFNIRKGAGNELPEISLLSHKTSEGVLKKQPDWKYSPYLTCYFYQEERLIDSLRIEHPLYRHLEYPGAEGKMGSKDTLVGSADFTIRFQTETPVNEIRIDETLRAQATHPISIIKL